MLPEYKKFLHEVIEIQRGQINHIEDMFKTYIDTLRAMMVLIQIESDKTYWVNLY